ncbi:hypothetical protein RJ639_024053 [Escallonia herrerae]|uniref:Leucine-rich repeat-containing N-terminal plant-type domain-containing protein n=1 Tax=Escallonia herrerae TaxID=1293975 RepID=A0AA89ADT9_9ASTE|nr:hypothetical protein RJ639_024053 [Escallonia herrerae]
MEMHSKASILGALVLHSCMLCLAISTSNFTDQSALLAFKSEIKLSSTHVLVKNWTVNSNFCDWLGVSCSRRRQRVTVLRLRGLGLQGTISPHIGNLSFLVRLDLRNNSFRGHLTQEIGHLRRLKSLALERNALEGHIPVSLYNCQNFKSSLLRIISLLVAFHKNLAPYPSVGSFSEETCLQEPRGVPAKEVLRESAQSPKPFDAHTLRSKLSSYDLKLLRERCEIHPIVKLRLPEEDEYANMATIDEIGVYWDIRRPKAEANLFPHPPSSNHNWKERFLFVKLPKSQRREVCNEWLAECDTRTCNKLKEKDLSETDLEHIEKLKGAESLESRYPLSNAQLRECGIIFPPKPQDFDEEEEEGENDPENMSSRAQGDPPLFNSQGVLGDIIPDELASMHGIEEEEMQDLDFDTLVSGPQAKEIPPQAEEFVLGLSTVDKSKEAPRKRKVSGPGGSRATSSSSRVNVPHRPAWGISVEESVFKSPRTAWDWSRHAIILMDRKTLSAYGVADTANGMVQLMSQAMAQVQIGAEKLIAIDKVLDEEKKKVMVENNCRMEAEKKVDDLSKKVERLELANTELSARIDQSEAEKSTVALQAVQMFKKSKTFTDQRFCDSKRAIVHGYNECKTDIQKDHPEFDLSLYKHKFAREIAADDFIRAEEAERRKGASSRAMASPSIGRSLGASGSTSRTVSRRREGRPISTGISASVPKAKLKGVSPVGFLVVVR